MLLEDLDRVGRSPRGRVTFTCSPPAARRSTRSRIGLDRVEDVVAPRRRRVIWLDDERGARRRARDRVRGAASVGRRAGRALSSRDVGGDPRAVGRGQAAVAAVDDRPSARARRPGSCSMASSAFVDSASPGRNEVDSFFSASVELADGEPAPSADDAATSAATTHFARRPAARSRGGSSLGPYGPTAAQRAAQSSSASSSSGSVTGRWQRSARTRRPRRGRRPACGPASSGTPSGARRRRARRAGGSAPRTTRASARDVVADERDLARRGARWKSSACSRWPNACGCAGAISCEQRSVPARGLLVARLAGERGEPQQPERRARRAGRDRVVVEVLAPRDEPLVVVGGREEAAALGVGEALDHRVGERARLGEPALLERRLVERRAAPRAGTRGPRGSALSFASAAVVGAQQAAVGVAQLARARTPRARRARRRGSRRARAPRRPRRARRSSARSTAVRRLSSRPGPHALLARRRAARARISAQLLGGSGAARSRMLRALEVALRRSTPKQCDRRRRRRRRAPRAARRASRRRTCPRRPRSRRRARSRSRPRARASRAAPSRASPRRRAAAARRRVDLPAVQVGAREQRVVVEHLLEVRDGPARGRPRSARSRRRSGRRCRRRAIARSVCSAIVALAAAQQELDRRGGRELRRAAEAAVLAVVAAAQAGDRGVERRPGRAAPSAGARSRARPRAAATIRSRCCAISLALLAPRLGDRRRAPAASSASRGAARAGSRCRRRTAPARA